MTNDTAGGATLTQVVPATAEIEPDPSETQLRALYQHRPGTIRLGLIASKDGKAAGPDGSSRSLNGDADLRVLRVLRAVSDVVVVGGNTARKERYGVIKLSADLAKARRLLNQTPVPALAIVTYTGHIPPDVDPSNTWILTSGGSPAIRRLGAQWTSRILLAGTDVFSPRGAIKELESRGLKRILCEGGPRLAVRFMDRAVINDYCLTTSPESGGETGAEIPPVPAGFRLAHSLVAGDYKMERWTKS